MRGSEIKVFDNKEFGSIRTIMINKEPYFVGKDVAKILGYSNTSKALSDHVDSEDKLNNESLSSLGQRGGWLINESGLYSLILGSKLPAAKKFKRWVTSEVLPTIRKNGMYATDELLDNPDFAIKVFSELKAKREKIKALEEENLKQKEVIEEYKPKAEYCEKILQTEDSLNTTIIAKDYGMSATSFNDTLNKLGIQYKVGNTWVLYQKYADKKYVESNTYHYTDSYGKQHSNVTTKWTQCGRLFLYNFLKNCGIIPLVEQVK